MGRMASQENVGQREDEQTDWLNSLLTGLEYMQSKFIIPKFMDEHILMVSLNFRMLPHLINLLLLIGQSEIQYLTVAVALLL